MVAGASNNAMGERMAHKTVICLSVALALAIMAACAGCIQGSSHLRGGSAPGFSIPADTRLAVIAVSKLSEDIRNIAADVLTGELLKLGLQVVERQQMDFLLQEQNLSVSGVTEGADYKSIGRVLDVRYLVLLNVSEFSDYEGVWASGELGYGKVAFSMKLVEIETGVPRWSASAHKNILSQDYWDAQRHFGNLINDILKKHPMPLQ